MSRWTENKRGLPYRVSDSHRGHKIVDDFNALQRDDPSGELLHWTGVERGRGRERTWQVLMSGELWRHSVMSLRGEMKAEIRSEI